MAAALPGRRDRGGAPSFSALPAADTPVISSLVFNCCGRFLPLVTFMGFFERQRGGAGPKHRRRGPVMAHDACLASAASVFSLSSRWGPEGTATQLLMPPYTECTGVSAAPRGKSKVWLSAQGAHNRAHVCCPSVTLSQVPHLTQQPPTRHTGALDACLFLHQAFSSQSPITLQDSAQTSSVKASSAPAPQHSVYTFHLCGHFRAGLKSLGLRAAQP